MRYQKLARSLKTLAAAATAAGLLAGCESQLEGPRVDGDQKANAGVVRHATGGGRYLLAGTFDVQFAFSAGSTADGRAFGEFHQQLEADGLLIDFSGEVTCMSVDEVNGRAWIGGIITQNDSTDPDFQQDIHQPGRDIWFRVLDQGEAGSEDADRTTFLGFQGSGGIQTSREYCETKPWPADNARTHPVTAGNIQVSPRLTP